jgi:threonine dehydratase
MEIIWQGASRIVRVSDEAIFRAMRHIFEDTHNVAEGAGAAGVAAAWQEREANRGRRVGVVLSGGNVDVEPFARALATPA